MSEIKIEKGIPAPTLSGKTKYPLADMEVGDSFLVPFIPNQSHELMDKRVRASVYGRQTKLNMKFAVRVTDGGIRCWRTA